MEVFAMKTAQQSCAATTPAPRNLSLAGKTATVTGSTCDADLTRRQTASERRDMRVEYGVYLVTTPV
jgi:hypothetical protein